MTASDKGKLRKAVWAMGGAFVTLATVLGSGQQVWAQTSPRHPVEFSIFTGNSFTSNSDIHLRQPANQNDATFHNMEWQGRPFSGSFYYGYRFATFLPRKPRLGFEVDLLHYKVYAKVHEQKRVSGVWHGDDIDETAEVFDRVQEFRITNGVNVLTFGAMYRVPLQVSPAFPQGRIQPYIGGGPAYYILYAINTVDHEANSQRGYKAGGWGYVAQTGVRYALTRNFLLFAEGRYNNGTADVAIADGGRGHTHLSTLHTIGGATVRF